MVRALLELLIPSVCPACDAPRRGGEVLLCTICHAGLERIDRAGQVRTAFLYRGTALTLVRRFKFEGRRDALDVLIEALIDRVTDLELDGIVPIPRHPDRIRELGCDPVHALAKRISSRLRTPLWEGHLERMRATTPQTDLSPDERRRNVAGCFWIDADALAGMRILLVDDVVTTGATLAEAARILERRSGAHSVACAALAAAPDPGLLPLPTPPSITL